MKALLLPFRLLPKAFFKAFLFAIISLALPALSINEANITSIFAGTALAAAPKRVSKEASREASIRAARPERSDSYLHADRLTRTKRNGRVTIILEGNARIRHKKTTLYAARIEARRAEQGGRRAQIYLTGGVRVYDHLNGIGLRSQRAYYDRQRGQVELRGAPFLKSRGSDPIIATCTLLRRDLDAGITWLEKDVRIYHGDWSIVADQAIERSREKEIELQKDPMLFAPQRFLVGREARYLYQEKRILMNGEILFALRQDPRQKLGEEPGKELGEESGQESGEGAGQNRAQKIGPEDNSYILSAERGEYPLGRRESKLQNIELRGGVLATRPRFALKTERLLIGGGALSELDRADLYTDSGVVITDLENNLRARAGIMDYRGDSQDMLLQQEPQVELLEKQTLQTKAIIKSVIMERDADRREIVARGNVRILQEERRIEGQRAFYREEQGDIVVEGEPRLRQSGITLRAERMELYPQEDRLQLKNQIEGLVEPGNINAQQ